MSSCRLTCVIWSAFLAGGAAWAQHCPYYFGPASNYCNSARVIPGSPGHHVVLMDANAATGEVVHGCDVDFGKNVWFEITPEENGWITVSTCHPATTYDTVWRFWLNADWNCETQGPPSCEHDDSFDRPECQNECYWGARDMFYGIAGVRTRIEVAAHNGNAEGCPMCLGLIVSVGTPCGEAPTNVACEYAREIPGTPGTHIIPVDVEGAIVPGIQPPWECTGNVDVGHSVWFKTTPTVSGPLTFSTCNDGTTYDTVIQAFAGRCDFMEILPCVDDTTDDPACDTGCGSPARRGSSLTIDASAGRTYYFKVSSYNYNSAGCDLCLWARTTLAECDSAADCDDTNPCTTDSCSEGACQHMPAPGSPCADDGNQCTRDICNTAGFCTHPFMSPGTPCGDPASNACDAPDSCDGLGTCSPNFAPPGTGCTPDDFVCTLDQCDSNGLCRHPNAPNGTACGSPNNTACDNPDTCFNGQCVPNLEPAGTLCRDVAGPCDVREGCTGSSPNCPADGFLSGGIVCRAAVGVCDVAEVCSGSSATCPANQFATSGTPCPDDSDECTRDICNGTGSCIHPPITGCCPSQYECCENADCDDGLYCNGVETCVAHVCQAGTPPCPPGSPCVEEGDRCGTDCNQNGIDDLIDLETGRSLDCNHNGVPDECEAEIFCFVINPEVRPDVPSLPGMGGGPERPLGAVRAPNGTRDQFVTNEVILRPGSQAVLEAFLATYAAEVIEDGSLPDPPPNARRDSIRWDYATSDYYLLRVNLERADLARLEQHMAQLEMIGTFEFSSFDGPRLSAIVAKERVVNGLNITPNTLAKAHDAQCVLSGTQEHPTSPGFFRDGFNFAFVSDSQLLVSRAWQYLDLLNLLNPSPQLAILDADFALNADFPAAASIPQYDFAQGDYNAVGTTGGGYHGTGSLSTSAARLNNQFGSVGTGGPVAAPMLFRLAHRDSDSVSYWTMAKAIRTSVYWGADVSNISWGGECGWWCRNFGIFSGMDSLTDAGSKAVAADVIVTASAGNDEKDMDNTTYLPCETNGVICVGAIVRSSKNAVRQSDGFGWGSNYGSRVDIWAPGDFIETAPNPLTGNTLSSFSGTSAAAPYAAGIVTMMKAINPNISFVDVRSLLQSTANPSPDSRVTRGFVNAYKAVKATAVSVGLQPRGDSFEPNNTESNARTLVVGTTTATITPGDVDFFEFDTTDYVDLDLRVVYRDRHTLGNNLLADFDGTSGTDTAGLIRLNQSVLRPGRHVLSVRGQAPDGINCYSAEMSTTASTISPDIYDDQTPPGEPRNDTFATAAVLPDLLVDLPYPIASENLDLNHDVAADIDYFTVQLPPDNEEPDVRQECCPLPLAPEQTQGRFWINIYPEATRPFAITVYRPDGSTFANTSGLNYVLECPHGSFPDGRVTFSVRDPAGRSIYEAVAGYHRCFSRILPDWWLEYEPPLLKWEIPALPDDYRLAYPIDPDVMRRYYEGTLTEPFPPEFGLVGDLPFPLPMPAHYKLDIRLPRGGPLALALINEDGNVVAEAFDVGGAAAADVAGELPGTMKRLEAYDLPPGMYFLRVSSGMFGTPYILDIDLDGDFNSDSAVDLRDVADFQNCFGASETQPPAQCSEGDLNVNGRIDLHDVPILLQSMTGPG